MEKTGAQTVIAILKEQQVDVVFGIPGGNILPLYDALHDSSIRHILAGHEQGAAFMAQGVSRTSNKTGVCLATSGPGASNLLTALADAERDRIPLVAITGQVSTTMLGKDSFQELDICAMAAPVCRYTRCVTDISDLAAALRDGFRIARGPRPGPVLIDIARDVFLARADFYAEDDGDKNGVAGVSPATINPLLINELALRLKSSSRPLIIAGGGVRRANAAGALERFARDNGIPVALTLHGLGLLDHDHPLNAGMIGMHGTPAANNLAAEADLIIGIGLRFDDRPAEEPICFAPTHIWCTLTLMSNVLTDLFPHQNALLPTRLIFWRRYPRMIVHPGEKIGMSVWKTCANALPTVASRRP
jgi:acetolactate synthase-1/2/3 large subunit